MVAADEVVTEGQCLLNELLEMHEYDWQANRHQRVKDVRNKVYEYCDKIPATASAKIRAEASTIRGRALITEETDQAFKTAEDVLSKAIKLDPTNSVAWNALGEACAELGDNDRGISCFESAVEHAGPNVESYKLMAMTWRRMKDLENKCVDKSIQMAKEATKIDPSDPTCWMVLGTGYFSMYLTEYTIEGLQKTLKAYDRAEKLFDKQGKVHPDLMGNKARVWTFLEEYETSAQCWMKAHEANPELGADRMAESAQKVVKQTVQQIRKDGGIKNRIKQQLMGQLEVGQLDPPPALKRVSLKDLALGDNADVNLVCKYICMLDRASEIPFPMLCVDHYGEVFIISVYQCNPKKMKETLKEKNGEVNIVRPFLKKIGLSTGEHYYSVRIGHPMDVLYNSTSMNHCGEKTTMKVTNAD